MQRSSDVVYVGVRTSNGCRISRTEPNGRVYRVTVTASQKIWNHSPSGFEWGYNGSGPAQTSLALLLDWTGNRETANRWHQPFKFLIVCSLPHDAWALTGLQIEDALKHLRAEYQRKHSDSGACEDDSRPRGSGHGGMYQR